MELRLLWRLQMAKADQFWVVAAEREDTLYCAIGPDIRDSSEFLTVRRNTLSDGGTGKRTAKLIVAGN